MEEELQKNNARDQRIAVRRARIQEKARLAKQSGETAGVEGKKTESKEDIGSGNYQIQLSLRKLLNLTLDTGRGVSAITLAADDRECQRRQDQENKRQALRERILAEAEASIRDNAALSGYWTSLRALTVPQELHEEIQLQQAACHQILEAKDRLILDLTGELKLKDDEYVRGLKQQAEDVDELLTSMAHEIETVQEAYARELNEVEAAFLKERGDLAASHKADLDKLLEKRDTMEEVFLQTYLETADSYHKQYETQGRAEAEELNQLKMRLEMDIQSLEEHLESMRATYQLNQEKLGYNYRVLMERDVENQSTINQQKRKIAHQRDVLSMLKTKYAENEKHFADQNVKVVEDYTRITDRFNSLQMKYHHFQRADARKVDQVKGLKEEAIVTKAKLVLEADRIIHEQFLGWQWVAPMKAASLESTAHRKSTSSKVHGGSSLDEATHAEGELEERILSSRNAGALSLLVDEAGFLVEPLAHRLLAGLSTNDAGLVHVRSVLRALGCNDKAAFDDLLEALTEKEPRRTSGAPDSERGNEQREWVHPIKVLERLRQFVEAENSEAMDGAVLSGPLPTSNRPSKVAGVTRRQIENERHHWRQLSTTVDAVLLRVWKATLQELEKCHYLLKSRSQAVEMVRLRLSADVKLHVKLLFTKVTMNYHT